MTPQPNYNQPDDQDQKQQVQSFLKPGQQLPNSNQGGVSDMNSPPSQVQSGAIMQPISGGLPPGGSPMGAAGGAQSALGTPPPAPAGVRPPPQGMRPPGGQQMPMGRPQGMGGPRPMPQTGAMAPGQGAPGANPPAGQATPQLAPQTQQQNQGMQRRYYGETQ